jgi:hypothetical protein
VAKAGDVTRISFAASTTTDVEVAILSGSNVVRHLAAGLLVTAGGADAQPAAPLKPGLAQTLDWDGRDDFGNTVARSGLSVRVRLGGEARLGKVLLDEHGLAFSPRAAAVGPDGLVYVLQEHGQSKSTFLLEAYTQDGKYVKTVMPYPADLPPERLAGLPRIALPDGRFWPTMQQACFRDLYPESTGMPAQTLHVTSKGWILMRNSCETHGAWGVTYPGRLLVVDTAGGTPLASYLGPLAASETMTAGDCWTAISPDEAFVYTTGHWKKAYKDSQPHNVIYRIGWTDKGPAVPFIGELYKPGNDETHLNAPKGMCTDARGRIYVCDSGNNRVAVFDAAGKWMGKLDINSPDQVAVDRKSGAIYVLTWSTIKDARNNRSYEQKIVKFGGVGAAAGPAVTLGLPYCTMTIDPYGKAPVLWLARTFGETAAPRRGVEKVEDLGDRLSAPVEVIKHRAQPDVYHVAASMVSDDVFVRGYSEGGFARVDGLSGEVTLLPGIKGHDLSVDAQGKLCVFRYPGECVTKMFLERYDRDGKPLVRDGQNVPSLKDLPGSHTGHSCTATRGQMVAPNGDLAMLGTLEKEYGVWRLDPEGRPRPDAAIRGISELDGSPVLDIHGNLYVAAGIRPREEIFPAIFGKKEPTRFYPWMYGSVVKFSPRGGTLFYQPREKKPGAVWPPEGATGMVKRTSFLSPEVYVKDATWIRSGFSVLPSSYFCCGCYDSRFCVDYYGRVYIPDAGQFSVFVVDAANNVLRRFGDYGNADSGGAGSRVSTPQIPLSWPYAVSVGKSGIYVSDFINRRLLRIDLQYAAEATCEIR